MEESGLTETQIQALLKKQAEKESSNRVTFTKYYLNLKANGSISEKIAFLREVLKHLPTVEPAIDLSGFSEKEITTRSLLVSIASVASWNLRGDHLDAFAKELDNTPEQVEQSEEVSALADVLD
jgi:hypothetical protein